MRDNRSALPKDSTLSFSDGKTIWIREEIGRGASCIVYDAAYLDNIGVWHNIRVKECFPAYLLISRENNGRLAPSECNQDKFEAAKQNFICAYKRNAAIRNTLGLTNSTINSADTVSYNNTVYIWMELNEGTDYKKFEDPSLKSLFTHIKTLAELIQKYHQNGYLHLDIKPENIFILPETEEHIILFDFDSMLTFEELAGGPETELSYSEGFSAPEQVQGRIDKIGKYTDIYSIGALLFYKLFNRTATSRECKISSTYHFEEMKYASEKYQPKLYRTLDTFFKKTLSVAIPPRWHDMQPVIQQLDELIQLADIDEIYLIDSFQYDSACFVGRNKEIEEMNDILSGNQLLFLSGIGGIGKTELAKQYANKYHEQYDTIIFSIFEKDIESLVCDEIQINKICREENESNHDYFERKIEVLKQIAAPKTLIIIDNFDVDSDEKLEILFRCPCKFIITTRMDFRDYNYKQLNVDRIENLNDILDLFCTYNNTKYSETENESVEKLIDYVDYHTMTVELIAKYLRNSKELPTCLYEKFLEREGTANTGEVPVKQRKDLLLNSESVNRHLSILFDVSAFDGIEKEIIGSLSLLAGIRIKKSGFHVLCAVENVDNKLEFLIKRGWIEYNPTSEKVSLHQVIQDLIYKNLAPNASNCPHIVAGITKYISDDSVDWTQEEIRKRVFQIFMERLSGNNIPYARLCFEYGKENRLDEAENICLGCQSSESFDLLQKIYRKKIELIATHINNSDLSESAKTDFPLNENLHLLAELLDKAALYCKKSSEQPDYIVKEYIETGKEIDALLSNNFNIRIEERSPELDNIYSKIIEMFDIATQILPSTSYSTQEKENFYIEIQNFYYIESLASYKDEYFSNTEKAYLYQELIDTLKATSEESSSEVIDINEMIRIEMNNLFGKSLGKKYERQRRFAKAIEYYKNEFEKGRESYDTTMENIAGVYFKRGSINKGIDCLEQAIAHGKKTNFCPSYIYVNLIEKLIKYNKFNKAKKYAIELINKEKPYVSDEDNYYFINSILFAYYILYTIEKSSGKKNVLWKKCLEYYLLLGDNEIGEELYDFIKEYLEKETILYETIIRIMERMTGTSKKGRNARKRIILQSIRKYKGKKGFEKYHVLLLIKLADLSNEYPYKNIIYGKRVCKEAQKYYIYYRLKDKYIRSLIYRTKAELIFNGKTEIFTIDQHLHICERWIEAKKHCNFKLLAERQILDHNCSLEEQVRIWNDAASEYGYTDNYDMVYDCLNRALEILRPVLNQYEFSKFDGDYSEIMQELITTYIRMNAYESAFGPITELYNRSIEYLLEIRPSGNICKSKEDNKAEEPIDNIEYYWEKIYLLADIAGYFLEISKTDYAVRTYLAAIYFTLAETPDTDKLKIGDEISNDIIQLCKSIHELFVQKKDILKIKRNTIRIHSLVNLKDRLLKCKEQSPLYADMYESITTIISDRYQYQEIEFKRQ